jgi:hypothetical protein
LTGDFSGSTLPMRLKLDNRWIKKLLRDPESGIGYQRVDLRFDDGREILDVAAFNAEEVEIPDQFANARITDVTLHSTSADPYGLKKRTPEP